MTPSSTYPILPGFESVFRFFDPGRNKTLVKILPGEYYITNSPEEVVTTTLGSCISVCIRDPYAGLGGMNHFMLPGSLSSSPSLFARVDANNSYGVFAMESLMNGILKFGGRRSRFEIKITGAGAIGCGSSRVGESNISFIEEFLKVERLRPLSIDLGGLQPRKVQYEPLTGRLLVKKLASLHTTKVVEQESRYSETLSHTPSFGAVELF